MTIPAFIKNLFGPPRAEREYATAARVMRNQLRASNAKLKRLDDTLTWLQSETMRLKEKSR